MGGDPEACEPVPTRGVAGLRGGRRGRCRVISSVIVPTLDPVEEDAMEDESSTGSPTN